MLDTVLWMNTLRAEVDGLQRGWLAFQEGLVLLFVSGVAPGAGRLKDLAMELVDLGGVAQADPAVLGSLRERYALEMDPASVPGLVERFGLRFPAEPLIN